MTDPPSAADSNRNSAPRRVGTRRLLFRLIRRAFLLVFLAGMLVAVVQIYRPASIENLRAETAVADQPGQLLPRDLLSEMRGALASAEAPVIISQQDLNRYIATTLRGDLAEPLGHGSSDETPIAVLVDLRPGACDFYLDVALKRLRITLMLSCEIEHLENGFIARMHHGQAGRLPLYGGLLVPGLPAFRGLADSFAPELEALSRMGQIELLDSEIRLHPRKP